MRFVHLRLTEAALERSSAHGVGADLNGRGDLPWTGFPATTRSACVYMLNRSRHIVNNVTDVLACLRSLGKWNLALAPGESSSSYLTSASARNLGPPHPGRSEA